MRKLANKIKDHMLIVNKIKDHMLLGSIYDNIMMIVKYNIPKLSFLYNVMMGQKHRMLYYKRLKKKFWNGCTSNPFWERREKVANKDIVWFCWLQGIDNAPVLVNRCLESLRKNLPNKNIIVIDENNLVEYVRIPDYIMKKWKDKKFGAAHFTDIIRLELLIQYGGYWIDSTVYCTDSKIFRHIDELPLFMYSFYYFGFNPEIMEANNWFLYGTTNQNILCLTREFLYSYWKKYNRAVDYYIFHLFLTMAMEYYKDEVKQMPIVSQVDAHILATYMFDLYDERKYKILKEQTGIHKLSNKFDTTLMEQQGTFYEVLIRKGLEQ